MFEHLADERPRAGGRVKDLYVFVDEISSKVLLAEVVGTFDHEAHDLVRCVDHTEAVGGFGVIDLIEVLVDDFQERLLLMVRADLCGGGTDGGVVRLHAFQRLVFGVALKESRLQFVKLAGNVIVSMKRRAGKDGGENVFGKDVLDQHLAHIGFREARVNRFLSVLEKFFRRLPEFRLALVGALDHGAERLQHHRQVGLELLDGFAELGNLRAFVAKEEIQ
jgi:hypothetical protein